MPIEPVVLLIFIALVVTTSLQGFALLVILCIGLLFTVITAILIEHIFGVLGFGQGTPFTKASKRFYSGSLWFLSLFLASIPYVYITLQNWPP